MKEYEPVLIGYIYNGVPIDKNKLENIKTMVEIEARKMKPTG